MRLSFRKSITNFLFLFQTYGKFFFSEEARVCWLYYFFYNIHFKILRERFIFLGNFIAVTSQTRNHYSLFFQAEHISVSTVYTNSFPVTMSRPCMSEKQKELLTCVGLGLPKDTLQRSAFVGESGQFVLQSCSWFRGKMNLIIYNSLLKTCFLCKEREEKIQWFLIRENMMPGLNLLQSSKWLSLGLRMQFSS